MKTLLTTLLIAFSVSATESNQLSLFNDAFLSIEEAAQVNKYMDDVCMDTYCGGDIIYYTKGLVCEGNSCTLKLDANGYGTGVDFNTKEIIAIENESIMMSEQVNAMVTDFDLIENINSEGELEEKTHVSFTCEIKNLNGAGMSYNDKRDLIYELVVFSCVDFLLEYLVYNK